MSALRALGRVAWRDIARHRGRSLLVVLLIALPVAAMVAGIALLRTTQPSQDRQDAEQFGRADLVAQGISEQELLPWLPDDAVIEPTFWSDGQLLVAGARPGVAIRGIDLDGLGQGMLTLVDGRAPKGTSEVAITAEVARIAYVSIGGTLAIDDAAPVTVVGLVENGLNLKARTVVVDPRAVEGGDPAFGTWLIGLPEGTNPEAVVAATYLPDSDIQNISLQSRTSSGLRGIGSDDSSSMILVLGTLALVEAALVASAAFSVSIRRRQRELGLLAASGATPGQLSGTVVAGAVILGFVACVVGIVVGLGLSYGLSPFLDEITQRRNPPILVDVAGLIGPAVIGFVAAVIAAVVPARTVARVPVLVSLSGRRPSEAPARRNLRVGLAVVVVSVALTLLGANLRLDGGSEIRLFLVIAGAVLGTLGFGACAPWLLERLDGIAARLPLASRIAFRDTARARSRSSPIVTAVLASVAATITLGTFTVSRNAENADDWRPYLHADELVVRGAGSEIVGKELAAAPGAIGGFSMTYLQATPPTAFQIDIPNATDLNGRPIRWCNGACSPEVDTTMVATPELLAISNAEGAAADLAAGRIVVLWPEPMTTDSVELVLWNIDGEGGSERRVRFPATVIVTGVAAGVLPGALIPPSVAADFGLEAFDAQQFIVRLDHSVTQADIDAATALAGRSLDTWVDASLGPQRPDESFRLLIIGLALLFAVSVTGIAIALGEAESRPEQRTLLSLGADPRLRRRIVAARAAVLALMAGILAVPAGLMPAWGLLASLHMPFAVPTIEILGAVVALPVIAVLGAWLLSRPIPDWNAFRGFGARE